MKDGFESLSLQRIGKDNGANGRALQEAGGVKYGRAKMVSNGGDDRGVRSGQLAGATVAVKDLKGGKAGGEGLREGGFARGDPACDPQNWHTQ